MSWYCAKLNFRIVCGSGSHSFQFDEQVRVVEACGETEAYEKILAVARKEEEPFLNANRQTVTWKFIGITELNEIGRLHSGMEIYSRINEIPDETEYLRNVNLKNESIRSRLLFLTQNQTAEIG